jgi:SNF2 family DNA or RNA helicase
VPTKRTSTTARRDYGTPTVVLDPYQVAAVRWLLERPYSGIFLDPGLGKTIITLIAAYLMLKAGVIDWLLVVAPLRPCYLVWPAEIALWGLKFRCEVLHGPDKTQAVRRPAEVYVINYEGLPWLHGQIPVLRARGTGFLALDESTKVKHRSSQRHRYVEAVMDCFGRRTILTGTPIPNGYLDLHGQVYCADKGAALGPFITQYRNEHFVPLMASGAKMTLDEYKRDKAAVAKWVPTTRGKRWIEERTRDLCIRFSDKEIGLKKPKFQTILVDLPDKARRVYESLESDFCAVFEGAGYALVPNAGALGIKLRQVANGGVLNDEHRVVELHEAKVEALVDFVQELSGEPLLAGFEFTADAARLEKALLANGVNAVVVSGTKNKKMTDQVRILDAFNRGEIQVVLAQYQCVAHGLNLQRVCRHVAFTGMIWDAEIANQFFRRVHRKGQKRQVIVHEFVARDTRDEAVRDGRKQKEYTQSGFLKRMEEWTKERMSV